MPYIPGYVVRDIATGNTLAISVKRFDPTKFEKIRDLTSYETVLAFGPCKRQDLLNPEPQPMVLSDEDEPTEESEN